MQTIECVLCLSEANQATTSSEHKITYMKSETIDCLWKWETRHNAESSQCFSKFTTDNRQYS